MPQLESMKLEKDSKSRRKKDMLALQKIGESLIILTESQLEKINLPNNLLTAIQHAKLLTSHEAKRRQLQYIGKIMRTIDSEEIKLALKNIQLSHRNDTARVHQIGEWRAKLIEEGDEALSSFLNDYPDSDRQQLRQLIRKAQQDRKNNRHTGAETVLFKYLRVIFKKA